MDISKLNKEEKCAFALRLAERAALYLSSTSYSGQICRAIEVGRNWMCAGKNIGEILYDFLDNEENGFTLLQEAEEDELIISALDCVIDAVACLSRAAYEADGEKYFPEPILLADDSIFTHMIHSLMLCSSTEKNYIEKIYQECLEKKDHIK